MILGLDIGTKRTGVAISAGDFAREHSTLGPADSLPVELAKLCEDEQVNLLVVGIPQNDDGTQSAQAEWVMQTVDAIRGVVLVPIVFEDEHLTSLEARRVLTDMGVPPEQIEARVDQYAAQLILQQYLNNRGEDEVI